MRILYDVLQDAIIGTMVAASALYMLRKLLPNWVRSRQSAWAHDLNQVGRPRLLRSLGKFIQPGEMASGGCGSGCSSCSSCASNPEAEAETKPLEFQRHI